MADRKTTIINKLKQWMDSTKGDVYRARNTPLILTLEEIETLRKRREKLNE